MKSRHLLPFIFSFFTPLPLFAGTHVEKFRAGVKAAPQALSRTYRENARAIHGDPALTDAEKEAGLKELNLAREELATRLRAARAAETVAEKCARDLQGRRENDPSGGVSLSDLRRASIRSIFEANIGLPEMLDESFNLYFKTILKSLPSEKQAEFVAMFEHLPIARERPRHCLAQVLSAIYELEIVRQLTLGGAEYVAAVQGDAEFRESRRRLALKAEWEYLRCVPFAIFRPGVFSIGEAKWAEVSLEEYLRENFRRPEFESFLAPLYPRVIKALR